MEVESKVRLTADEVTRLYERLVDLGVQLGPSEYQKDIYYKEQGFRSKVQGLDGYIVRVRRTPNGATLNMKRLTAQAGVWTEIETSVANGDAAEEILRAIGVEHAVNVTKVRRSCDVDGLEVVIDEIEELGTYLELAVEGEDLDVSAAKHRIAEFLVKLGILEDRIEYRGYPTILLEEQGVVFSLK